MRYLVFTTGSILSISISSYVGEPGIEPGPHLFTRDTTVSQTVGSFLIS
jgi:hypothetical protein